MKTLRRLISLLLLHALLPAWAADAAPAIRTLQRGQLIFPDAPRQLADLVAACEASAGLPAGSVRLPSEATLRTLVALEVEELFQGPMGARFESRGALVSVPANGCRPVFEISRNARVFRACGPGWRAHASASLERGDSYLSEAIEAAANPSCAVEAKRLRSVPEQLPRVPAGAGQSCVWADNMLQARMGLPLDLSAPTPDKPRQACRHTRWAQYPFNNERGRPRFVDLRYHYGRAYAPDPDSGEPLLQGLATTMETLLQAYQEGVAIPAHRFTREAAEAFVKQPSRIQLGEAK